MSGIKSIAMAVFEFPSISQTFISLQIDDLASRGYRIIIVNMGLQGDIQYLPEKLRNNYSSLEIITSSYVLASGNFLKKLILFRNLLINSITSPLSSLKTFRHLVENRNLRLFNEIHNDAYQFAKVSDTDIVHCQFSTIGTRYEKLIRFGFIKKNNKKLAVSIRGYDISAKHYVAGTDWPAMFSTFDIFLPVCRYFESKLRELGCNKTITIVRSPVNTVELSKHAVVKSERKEDKIYNLISVCRLVEKKGLDTAIEALSLMVNRYNITNLRYTIIGDGPQSIELKNLIKRNKIGSYVTFAGKMPTSETLMNMTKADILLAPSKTGSDGNSEGIPNVIKEAMAIGLQVISTYHAGIPELITHNVNGYLVPENDPESLTTMIIELINNRDRWKSVSDKASKLIYSTYSPSRATDELIQAYQSILNQLLPDYVQDNQGVILESIT